MYELNDTFGRIFGLKEQYAQFQTDVLRKYRKILLDHILLPYYVFKKGKRETRSRFGDLFLELLFPFRFLFFDRVDKLTEHFAHIQEFFLAVALYRAADKRSASF